MTFSVEQHRDVPSTAQNLPVSPNITEVVRERLPTTGMRGVSNASSLEHRPIENGVGESVVIYMKVKRPGEHSNTECKRPLHTTYYIHPQAKSPYCGPCCGREIMLGRDIRQWHAY
jgi:hypothetical protein